MSSTCPTRPLSASTTDTIRIDGTFPIDDFNERFHCDLPQEDYHTIAGFVFGELGRAAEPGDEVSTTGCASSSTRSKGSASTG